MAKLTPVTLDAETFWSTTHSLSKMSPISYIMHPDTEIISVAYKFADDRTRVIFGEEKIRKWFAEVDWSDKIAICHNGSGFDFPLFAWRFNFKPKMYACTLAMSRPIHAKEAGGSLAALVKHYELGVKDQSALIQTKGRHLKDFTPEEIEAMRQYNAADVDQCWGLFKKLLPLTSKDEMKLIDMTIRMLVEPQFVVDRELLAKTLWEERERKQTMLLDLAKTLNITGGDNDEIANEVCKTLGSAAKFSKLLEDLGVEVPTKVSPTTGKPAPALAKTDEAFIALQEHDNPVVAAAAQARLGVKSTLLESRIESFVQASDAAGGKLPIPIKYYGADTTGRDSGWAYNPQNLPRVSGKPSDALRNCLTAGLGKKVVVADLSGIELRVNHFLWKVPSSVALYQADPEKADLYKDFAAALYGIDKSEVSKAQRQVGKVAHLGLGFGAGAATFQKVAKLMGGVDLTLDESLDVVNKWRNMYEEIATGWRTCHDALADIYLGNEREIDPWGLCWTCKEGIRTPKGLIRYPNLRQELNEKGKKEWTYGDGRNKARIYAGKVTENCLAAGTLVLTDKGWKPIEAVGDSDLVHDGDNWVSHAGTVFKSVQPCVTIDGVYMTADHEVLDETGTWKEASQLPQPYRPAIRNADRLEPIAQRRKAVALGVQMSMRGADNEAWAGRHQGAETWGNPELRVCDRPVNPQEECHSRYDEAPGLRGLPQHGGPVQATFTSSVEKLRRSWNNGVRAVAGVLRELLGGHGADVLARVGLGSQGQQRAVFAGELQVGSSEGQHPEQAQQQAKRGYSCARSQDGHIKVDAVLPTGPRSSVDGTCGQPQGYEVYDILNAGPQHRFVVLGEGGPFIVHNCVQHLARNVIMGMALEIKSKFGLIPALRVHDELVYVVPEDKAEAVLADVQSVMRTPPPWWSELIVWSEGDIGDTYGSCK